MVPLVQRVEETPTNSAESNAYSDSGTGSYLRIPKSIPDEDLQLIDGFLQELSDAGYRTSSIQLYRGAACCFFAWIRRHRKVLSSLRKDEIEICVAALCRKNRENASRVRKLISYLRRNGTIPAEESVPLSKADTLLAAYRDHLCDELKLSISSVKCYVPKARKFILSVFGRDLEHIHSLSALSLRELILEEAKTNRRGIASFISPLPTLLRFLYQKRILKDDLRFAVPRLAIWDLASAPAFLSNQEVERLLAACNRTTAIGRRDYAILCLLAEIGLRGGAIVSLNLEDIDWEERTIGVVQKGGEVAVLPLMDKSYHAIADYLSKDRVQSAERRLFLRTEAPIRGFSSTAAISTLVERALKKAGIYKSRMGSHIFRHSLATRMINGGASLTEIGAVLGHKSPNTTRIYAKVDIESLRSIARQWVGNTAIVHESIGRIR